MLLIPYIKIPPWSPLSWFPVHTAYRGGRKITDGLYGINTKQNADSHAGRRLKVKTKVQRLRKLEKTSGRNIGKIHQSETGSRRITGDDTDENGNTHGDQYPYSCNPAGKHQFLFLFNSHETRRIWGIPK